MPSENSQPPTPRADPAAPQPSACANCGAPLYGKYCYACGQPVRGLVRHFGSVLGDIADSVLNVDARLFHTLVPLYLRPGRLTLDYFAGRRARYVTPFRLVFLLAIVTFFAAQLSLRVGLTRVGPVAQVQASSTGTISVRPYTPRAAAATTPFTDDSIRVNGHVWWNADTRPLHVRWLPDAVNAWFNDLIGNAVAQGHAMGSGSAARRRAAQRKMVIHMVAAAPTVVFVLLPVFAMVLKVFYLFRKRLYMEHLIVAMHSQAFVLSSLLVLVVLGAVQGWLAPKAGWIAVPIRLLMAATWIWAFVYLFRMQRRVYRQGWIMTTVKYCSIGLCYLLLMGLGWVFALLISLTGA